MTSFVAASLMGHTIAAEAASAEDEDLTIPRAAMNKMIKELLPNVRIANEARELILACCTEFIHHLSTEANDICNRQQKKTISADHVLGGELVFIVQKTLEVGQIFLIAHLYSPG